MSLNSYNRPVTHLDLAMMRLFPFRVIPAYAPALCTIQAAVDSGKLITRLSLATMLKSKNNAGIYWADQLASQGLIEFGARLPQKPRKGRSPQPLIITQKGRDLIASHPFTPLP